MKDLSELKFYPEFVLTDIDDTITDEGQLHAEAYQSLWNLHEAGIKVVPVTGRPAGWCEMIARMWPVDGVIGENGGLYFRYHEKKMLRRFSATENEIQENRKKLNKIEKEILEKVPGSAIASDQFCRLFDLAIDFCEDVPPLADREIQLIVDIFLKHGAQAKVSSIHVNGWFGTYNKVTMIQKFLQGEFGLSDNAIKQKCLFSGDSPNDEPMFEFFPQSVGVANIKKFQSQLKHEPQFVTSLPGGKGFAELTRHLLSLNDGKTRKK